MTHLPILLADSAAGDHMGGFGWVMMLIWTVLMVVVLILFFWMLRRDAPMSMPRDRSVGPIQVLSLRLARGEIAEDEYQRILAALEGSE